MKTNNTFRVELDAYYALSTVSPATNCAIFSIPKKSTAKISLAKPSAC
jgi:hypothetical protein